MLTLSMNSVCEIATAPHLHWEGLLYPNTQENAISKPVQAVAHTLSLLVLFGHGITQGPCKHENEIRKLVSQY